MSWDHGLEGKGFHTVIGVLALPELMGVWALEFRPRSLGSVYTASRNVWAENICASEGSEAETDARRKGLIELSGGLIVDSRDLKITSRLI